jgi:hypothetical protein
MKKQLLELDFAPEAYNELVKLVETLDGEQYADFKDLLIQLGEDIEDMAFAVTNSGHSEKFYD